MPYDIYLCSPFKRSIKRLTKRFPHVKDDAVAALRELTQNPMLGVLISGAQGVRKLRVRSTDLRRGKSGGFRLLYLVDSEHQLICPLLIYAKSDRANVARREIKTLLRDLSQELNASDEQS